VAEPHVEREEREERVTPLELFFDLVFVFAITQVTAFLADDATWGGVVRGMLVLAALWWAWAAYAWLTNTVSPDEGGVRLAMLGGMAAMLVVALAVPTAFGEDGVLFAVAYLIVRILHLVLYALAAKGDHDLLEAVARLTPTAVLGPLVLVLAGFLDGDDRVAAWALALLVDFLGPAVFGAGRGWRVHPAHFAERHALIVIIALGESIVAIGVGATSTIELTPGVVAAAGLGVVVIAGLWWLYFDVAAIFAQRRLTQVTGVAQARMARDAYSYLHFPMVAGIVLFALALKKTLGDVDDPLGTVPAFALFGGLAIYLLAHIAFLLRTTRHLFRRRLLGAAVLLALLPLGMEVAALAALGLAGAVCVGVVAFEAIRHREDRALVRHPELA
jgi:low temperature requirement protein LtrA